MGCWLFVHDSTLDSGDDSPTLVGQGNALRLELSQHISEECTWLHFHHFTAEVGISVLGTLSNCRFGGWL